MQAIQTYETTISDPTGRLAVTCLVVPSRAARVNDLSGSPEEVKQALDLKELRQISPSALPYALGSLLLARNGHDRALELYQKLLESPVQRTDEVLGTDLLSFAESACFEELIPFENSPLESVSLASLVKSASATAMGAYIGFVVAGSTPLLFIAVPTGMVICGAASGAAAGLKKGIEKGAEKITEDVLQLTRKRLLKWLTKTEEHRTPSYTKRSAFQPMHGDTVQSSNTIRGSDLPIGDEWTEVTTTPSVASARERFKITLERSDNTANEKDTGSAKGKVKKKKKKS